MGILHDDEEDLRAELAKVTAERDKALAARGRWVPVGERLPDLDTPVIAATDSDGVIVVERSVEGDEWLWAKLHNGSMLFDDVAVTHWMPLPQPPEVKP